MDEINPVRFFSLFQNTGDIAFVSSSGPKGLNRLGQELVRRSQKHPGEATFTHVLICVEPGLWIHADPSNENGGVDFLLSEERGGNFLHDYPNGFRINRHHSLSDSDKTDACHSRSIFHYGKAYRLIKPGAEGAFCSQLVAHVLEDLGIKLPMGLSPHEVLPFHLEHMTREEKDWSDVTAEYQNHYERKFEYSSFEITLDRVLAFPDTRHSVIEMARTYLKTTNQLIDAAQTARNFIDQVHELQDNVLHMSTDEFHELTILTDFDSSSFKARVSAQMDLLWHYEQTTSEGSTKIQLAGVSWKEKDLQPIPGFDVNKSLDHIEQNAIKAMKLHATWTSAVISVNTATLELNWQEVPSAADLEWREQFFAISQKYLDSLAGEMTNYDSELAEVLIISKENFSRQPLTDQRSLRIYQLLTLDLDLRKHLNDPLLRESLHALSQNPYNTDAMKSCAKVIRPILKLLKEHLLRKSQM